MTDGDRSWLVAHPILGVTFLTVMIIGPMALGVAVFGLRGAALGTAVASALVVGWVAGYWKLKSITQTKTDDSSTT